ncbi:MAG: phenylacetate-CoA oxygenase subunit PaaJ [Actinomycetota bacterium]|nr:phenylacetate-CoA oxygenase subunit PaaJ [Actinomycetota bacterium]
MKAIELAVWEALAGVHDPEIPPLAITDLGIVKEVRVEEDRVEVDLLPTFVGCPALDAIREDATRAALDVAGDREVTVRFVFSPPWTSDRITPEGREALRSYGLTPPGESGHRTTFIPLASLERTEGGMTCPFCGSDHTVLESAFGPTLCRTTHFCRSCRNAFEGFKPKLAG